MREDTISWEFKAWRKHLGVSQLLLAKLSGVSRYKICLHEIGIEELDEESKAKIQTTLEDIELEYESDDQGKAK